MKEVGMSRYDLAVAYRIYPGVSKSPAIVTKDKLELAEICLRSFKLSLGTLRVKLWALLDGCPPEYERLFLRYFRKQDVVPVRLAGVGNAGSFTEQLRILCDQQECDLVYLAEDDYFYLENQFLTLIEFLRAHDDADFVSPYDHPDYYSLDLHRGSSRVKAFGGKHWRTVNSTCLTFLTRKETLQHTRNVFETFARRNYDASIWLSLTKSVVFNPEAAVRFFATNMLLFKILAKAWLFGWRQILFGRRWKIWIPLPSIATHMEESSLAPIHDWPGLFSRARGKGRTSSRHRR